MEAPAPSLAPTVRFTEAPVEHGSDDETATQALINSRERRDRLPAAPTASVYHSELSSASLSYSLSSSPSIQHLYNTEEEDSDDSHGAPGSRRYRRYLNTIVSDYESETDNEDEADPHIVRFEWKSDFIAVGDAFFQGGLSEPRPHRAHRARRHRLPTHSADGVILYGQEIAPQLYRRLDARVRPLLKKMPQHDCHLITQLEHLIRAFKNDSWQWSHREQILAAREAQREADRDAYHERLQQMTLSSSPDTDSFGSDDESCSSMVYGTPPSRPAAAGVPVSPPSPVSRPRFTVSEYLSRHRPTAFTLLPSSSTASPSRHRSRSRTERHRRRKSKRANDSSDDDDEDGFVVVEDPNLTGDDHTLAILFQDSFQRLLGHAILHFHQLASTSETVGRSKPQRVTYVSKPPSSSSKPIYTHNASLLTHLQQLHTARLVRQQARPA